MLVSSQRFVWISEKYNMTIYWAESWIEQALYEINIHDIWFNDSTSWKIQNWLIKDNWFLSLNWKRLQYKWWVKWVNQSNTEEGFLVWKWNIDKIPSSNINRKYFKDYRNFFLYRDLSGIWENNLLENICNLDSSIIDFSVDWNNIYTDNLSYKTNIVQWRLNTKEKDESWTWYSLESSANCLVNSNPENPFCYKQDKAFTHNWRLEFDSTNNTWICTNSSWDKCEWQSIKDLLNKGWDPLTFNPYKPELRISYQNKLFESWLELEWIPIRYNISWCNDPLPSLVQEIESTSQTYWSVQKITTKIYQGNEWIDLSYTIIQ